MFSFLLMTFANGIFRILNFATYKEAAEKAEFLESLGVLIQIENTSEHWLINERKTIRNFLINALIRQPKYRHCVISYMMTQMGQTPTKIVEAFSGLIPKEYKYFDQVVKPDQIIKYSSQFDHFLDLIYDLRNYDPEKLDKKTDYHQHVQCFVDRSFSFEA